MSVFEVRSTLTYLSLINKSKSDLAHLVLMLCDTNAALEKNLAAADRALKEAERAASEVRP